MYIKYLESVTGATYKLLLLLSPFSIEHFLHLLSRQTSSGFPDSTGCPYWVSSSSCEHSFSQHRWPPDPGPHPLLIYTQIWVTLSFLDSQFLLFLYACIYRIFVCRLHLSLKLQSYNSNCLLSLSTWIYLIDIINLTCLSRNIWLSPYQARYSHILSLFKWKHSISDGESSLCLPISLQICQLILLILPSKYISHWPCSLNMVLQAFLHDSLFSPFPHYNLFATEQPEWPLDFLYLFMSLLTVYANFPSLLE